MPAVPWRAALALLLLLLGAVLFLKVPGSTLWQRVLQDAGHGPVFAGIAGVLVLLSAAPTGRVVRPFTAYLRAFLLALAIGVGTELVQSTMPNRSVSGMDIVHDAAGAILGLALVWLLEQRRARPGAAFFSLSRSRTAVAMALVACVILGWQPLRCAVAYAERDAALPTLAPAGRVADARFVDALDAALDYTPLPQPFGRADDGDSIRLRFGPDTSPGLMLTEPYPDWRAFRVLALDVTNPGPTAAAVVIRVNDASHDQTHADRFNAPFELAAASRTTLRIPLAQVAAAPATRRMDMGSIVNVIVFASRPMGAGTLYVTRAWLEK